MITAALIILIAAFNGIEQMVEKLYSEFEPSIIIQAKKGKTIDLNTFPLELILKNKNVKLISKIIEEIVIAKHEKKWVNAKIYGVDSSFIEIAKIPKHIVDGKIIYNKNEPIAVIGASLLDKLNAYIHTDSIYENLSIYIPKRNAKIHSLSSPFKIENILISGRINYNREINDEAIILPFDYIQTMMNMEGYCNSIYLSLKDISKLEKSKNEINSILSSKYKVITYLEKNKLIFQTSKSEKLIVFYILIFIFILALFNLVSSLTMLFIEKKENMRWLNIMGLNFTKIKYIFLLQGIFISLKGIIIGYIIGLGLVLSQIRYKFIVLPNTNNQAFPVVIKLNDIIIILSIVIIFSILASFFTVNFLNKSFKLKKNEK